MGWTCDGVRLYPREWPLSWDSKAIVLHVSCVCAIERKLSHKHTPKQAERACDRERKRRNSIFVSAWVAAVAAVVAATIINFINSLSNLRMYSTLSVNVNRTLCVQVNVELFVFFFGFSLVVPLAVSQPIGVCLRVCVGCFVSIIFCWFVGSGTLAAYLHSGWVINEWSRVHSVHPTYREISWQYALIGVVT